MGVTSLMDLISTPAACRARIADSRPLPGPFTRMSRDRSLLSLATVAAAVAACWAAKGVPLREPLNPRVAALDQVTTWPSMSVMVTWVLLKEAWTWAIPCTTWRFSFLLFLAAGFSPAALSVGLSVIFFLRSWRGGLLHRADHRPPRALPGAGVRVGALAPHREVAAVPHAPVGPHLHQTLDVHGDVLAEVALHPALGVDDLRDAARLLLGEVLDPHVRIDLGLAQDPVTARDPDAVDVGESDLHALLARKVDARDTCHSLPLPLLVLLVRADDVDDALPPYHLALHADLLDRRPYFHCYLESRRRTMRPRVMS